MATLKGRGGKLQVSTPDAATDWQAIDSTDLALTDVGQIMEWSISVGMGSEEITEFGNTWTERVATLKDWSGSARGYLEPVGYQNQDELMGQLITGGMTADISGSAEAEEVIKGCFFTDLTGDSGFVGNMIVSFEVNGSVGGVFEVSFSFQGTGELEYSTTIDTA